MKDFIEYNIKNRNLAKDLDFKGVSNLLPFTGRISKIKNILGRT